MLMAVMAPILLVLVLTRCTDDRGRSPTPAPTAPGLAAADPAHGAIRLSVTFAPWRSGTPKFLGIQAVDAATAYVYDSAGTEVMHQGLDLSGGRATGRITVLAQDDLRVVLVYLDGSTVRYIGEDGDVDVPRGGEAVAHIEAEYMGTWTSAPDSVAINSQYTVAWAARPHATGYSLEEDTEPGFSGAVVLYAGSATSYVVPGKAQPDTFYYRARVRTKYGIGPWHSTGWDSTGVPGTGDGVIVIDVPVPADEPEVRVALPGGATMDLVWVQPGTFLMGSPDSEDERETTEGPQHHVTISQGFYLGKCEVTQAQWQSVMGTTPWSGQGRVQEHPNHPAVYISWHDVQAFIGALNEAAGEEAYRMPTEAEAEYASRAGTTTPWSFGADGSLVGQYAWHAGNTTEVGEDYAHMVGTKLPNPWGLYDMHGNVNEWCQDFGWSGDSGPGWYTGEPRIDPTGPATGSRRIVRNGDFAHSARYLRSAYRHHYAPSVKYFHFGARVVRIR